MRELAANDFSPPSPAQLGSDEIHLWFFPQGSAAARNHVSPLRALLAGYLDADPARLRIERDAHGKPHLAGTALQFNLSHSGGALLIGVSRNMPLGVDLEASRRARPVLALARRFFDPAEAAALAALPEAQRLYAFLELWSCKEAVLKALGRGIAFGLDRLVFELDPHGAVAALLRLHGDPDPRAWRLLRLRLGLDLTGAMAWRGRDCTVRAFNAGTA